MSRLGKLPIKIPSGVEVVLNKGIATVKGRKGTLSRPVPEFLTIENVGGEIFVKPVKELKQKYEKAMWGTIRAQIANMVKGVSDGWEKSLEINGVGYSFKVSGNVLQVNCGYSHDVLLSIPEGITCTVDKNILRVSGIDKDIVGNFASRVRSVKKADVYLAKGIKYVGEVIRRKAGKSVKK